MNIFLISATGISLFALFLVFFALPKKINFVKILGLCIVLVISISGLFYKVVDLPALKSSISVDEEIEIEEQRAIETQLQKARMNPNDILAWNKLGQIYVKNSEYVNAYMAFTQSEQLDSYVGLGVNEKQARSERLKWLTGLAEARILAQGGGVDEQAKQFIQRSLSIDAQHPKALWYGGLAAAQEANFPRALELWNKLMQLNPPEPLKTVVQTRLNTVQELLQIENQNAESQAWELGFKLEISEKLLSSKTPETRLYASIRPSAKSPPIIAKSFDLDQFSSADKNLIVLRPSDTISGMAGKGSLDWSKTNILNIIWAQDGKVLSEDNVRLEYEITKQNLDRVFEYTLE